MAGTDFSVWPSDSLKKQSEVRIALAEARGAASAERAVREWLRRTDQDEVLRWWRAEQASA